MLKDIVQHVLLALTLHSDFMLYKESGKQTKLFDQLVNRSVLIHNNDNTRAVFLGG